MSTFGMKVVESEPSLLCSISTYLSYVFLIIIGGIRDVFGKVTGFSRYSKARPKPGYGELVNDWAGFYTRRLYSRIQDTFNRPINSNPGARIDVMKRYSDDNMASMKLVAPVQVHRQCLNLSSYNYLGFGDDWSETCAEFVLPQLDKTPVSLCSSRSDFGTTAVHKELEACIASFLGKEDAIALNMGYGTNATVLPALCGKGDLIISDKLNHSSIVNGCRTSGALVRSFPHNDPVQLDQILRESIALGQPRTRLRWRKVLVVVEGIYSMEGEICRLKEIAAVAKKYKAYVYLDEAHSIGALGKTGRGVTEYHGVDTKDIAICMGTFTKSFGGMGGYIAADRSIIQHLRRHCAGMIYHNSMSPVIAAQVLRALRIIRGDVCGDLGKRKLASLNDNANFFRKALIDMGLHLYGDWDSPIIPVLIYMPMKLSLFSRLCLSRGLAVVVVCFPATTLETGRVRFCISAAHTKEDLKEALATLDEVADIARIKYSKNFFP